MTRTGDGFDDGCVARSDAFGADEWFDDGVALDFVVVLADDPVFGCDVGVGEECEECILEWDIFGGCCFLLWCGPSGGASWCGDAIMHKGHGEATDFGAFKIQDQLCIVRPEVSKVGELDMLFVAYFLEEGEVFFGDGEHHTFLGFGDPDFSVGQACVFEWGLFEIDKGADLFAHFANGT